MIKNKWELEKKKFLAEWMGKKLYRKNYLHSAIWYFEDGSQLSEFDPWNKHEHFAEVWKNLENTSKIKVTENFIDFDSYDDTPWTQVLDAFLFNLPTVCEATYQILKENAQQKGR